MLSARFEWDDDELVFGDERLSANAHEYSRRARTPYEQRVDFAQAKKVLDAGEEPIRERLMAELKTVQDSTIKDIEAHPDFDSDYVRNYTVQPDVQRTLQDMFETAWNDGRDAGASELPVRERKNPAVVDVRTFFNPRHVPSGEHGGEFAPADGVEIWDPINPTREQLDRAQKIGKQFFDGPLSDKLAVQMHGAVVKGGKATMLTPATKLRNLMAIKKDLDALKQTDPAAYENYRRWSVGDAFGVKDYKDLPAEVTVFRGAPADEPLAKATNVSLKRDIAERFGAVTEYQISPAHIGYVMGGSSSFAESELLVFDTSKLKPVGKFAEWDESKHPRSPAGTEAGGEFAPSGEQIGDKQLMPWLMDKEKLLDLPIANGLKKAPLVKAGPLEASFGDCTNCALNFHRTQGGDLYVGSIVVKESLAENREWVKTPGHFGMVTGISHAWNIKDGKIYDTTLGSKEAADYLYFGFKVPDDVVKRLKNGDELASWHTAQMHKGYSIAWDFCPAWAEFAEWDESKHKRQPKGSESGGEFAPAEGDSGELKSSTVLKQEKSKIAAVAQSVYDSWDENVDEFAGGGICHLIAEEIAGHLSSMGIDVATVSAEIGEQHVWVVAKLKDGVYEVDIPPSLYETGGGYSWKKIPDVKFDESDIIVDRIDANPDHFDRYTDYADWDESKHPRQPVGSEKGGEFAPGFHGTSIKNAEKIKTEGLKAGSWSKATDSAGGGVHFVTKLSAAHDYAVHLGFWIHPGTDRYAVVAFEIPKDQSNKITPDAFDTDNPTLKKLSPLVFHGDIPPEWIKSVTIYGPDRKVIKKLADEDGVGYAVVFLDERKNYDNAFEPTEAIKAFENRAWLIRDVIGNELQTKVRYELFEHLKGARSMGQTVDNIKKIFEPFVGDPSQVRPGSNVMDAYRIRTIVRTEQNYGYNQGRLAIADAAGAYILGFSYSAILDERTSDICNAADGLVLRKDAPATTQISPPNHPNCRSILVFVTADDVPVKWSTQRQINKVMELIPKGWK